MQTCHDAIPRPFPEHIAGRRRADARFRSRRTVASPLRTIRWRRRRGRGRSCQPVPRRRSPGGASSHAIGSLRSPARAVSIDRDMHGSGVRAGRHTVLPARASESAGQCGIVARAVESLRGWPDGAGLSRPPRRFRPESTKHICRRDSRTVTPSGRSRSQSSPATKICLFERRPLFGRVEEIDLRSPRERVLP